MKAVILIILSLVLNTTSVFASGNSVESYLPNIRDRVRNCTVLPYHFKNSMKMEHALQSHCPEVKVLPMVDHQSSAKINVAGHRFIASLVETEYSDGDFFDVEIRDLTTNESFRLYNAPAYGDVLLGVLGGDTNGLTQTLVND